MEYDLGRLMSEVGSLHENHEGHTADISYAVLGCPAAAAATAAATAGAVGVAGAG